MRLLLLLFSGSLLSVLPAAAQEKAPGVRNVVLGAGLSSAISYTGINAYALADVQLGRHAFYAGPKLVLSDNYLPGKSSYGYDAGYSYTAFASRHWVSTAGVDFQSSYYTPFNAKYFKEVKKNTVNELTFSLGMAYVFDKSGRLSLGLNLGTGMFFERYQDLGQGTTNTNSGLTQMVRLNLHYNIRRL